MPPVSCPWASNPKVGVCSLPPLQVLVIRLRDSLIKMGEELSQAATAEAQQRESSQYYQRRLEELKADMQELVEREAEASRRCMELVSVDLRRFFSLEGLRLERGQNLVPVGQAANQKEMGREIMLPLAANSGGREGGPKWTNGGHSWMTSKLLCVSDSRSYTFRPKGWAASCKARNPCL